MKIPLKSINNLALSKLLSSSFGKKACLSSGGVYFRLQFCIRKLVTVLVTTILDNFKSVLIKKINIPIVKQLGRASAPGKKCQSPLCVIKVLYCVVGLIDIVLLLLNY